MGGLVTRFTGVGAETLLTLCYYESATVMVCDGPEHVTIAVGQQLVRAKGSRRAGP